MDEGKSMYMAVKNMHVLYAGSTGDIENRVTSHKTTELLTNVKTLI